MTTIAVITDTHIGKQWKNARIETTLMAFADEMETVKPDMIIHAGDVFNVKRPTSDSIEFATKWFMRLANSCDHLILIPGGHDQDIPRNTTAIDFADDLTSNIVVIYEPVEWSGLFMMPYQRRLTDEHIAMIANSNIAILHQGIDSVPLDNGKRMYGNVADAVPYNTFDNVKLAVIGHMHTPWTNGSNICVLGSPYQTSYSHAITDRNYMLFDLENPSQVVLHSIPSTYFLKKLTLSVNNDITSNRLIKMLPSQIPQTYMDITIGVEGALTHSIVQNIKHTVISVYGDWIDNIDVVSVLTTAERVLKQEILATLAVNKGNQTPSDWLDIWMEKRGEAYFKSKPAMKELMHSELREIISLTSK